MHERDDYSWLRAIARESAVGDTHRRMRELFLPEIIVDADLLASDDVYAPIEAIIEFVNWAQNDARLIPGEFPQEALWSYHVDYYIQQVDNGGHGQYVGNSGWLPETIGACARGLKAIGADDYAAIYSELRTLISSDEERAAAIAEGGGFGEPDPVIKSLDDRFFALNGTERVVELNAAWIKTSPRLAGLSPTELDARKEKIAKLNDLRGKREREVAHHTRRLQMSDPTFRMADRLCGAAGIKLHCLTGFGPFMLIAYGIRISDIYGFRVSLETAAGPLAMFLLPAYGLLRQPAAVLAQQMGRGPLKAHTISMREYKECVPEAWRIQVASSNEEYRRKHPKKG